MKNIIIFTYYARHLEKLVPLIKLMEENDDLDVSVILMTREEQRLADEKGIKYKMIDCYIKDTRTQDFDPAWGLIGIINAIDQIKPDLLITVEVNYILRNVIRYCSQNNIKNLVIQHGTPNKYSMHAFAPFEGDMFLSWGDFTREVLIENGVQEDKIIITGGMNFDHLCNMKADRQEIADYFNIDASKKWITFTTQGKGAGSMPTDEEIKDGIVETAKALQQYKGFQLIYQVHPGQEIEDVKKILKENDMCYPVVGKYAHTDELIKESYATITFFSTTAIDAILLSKPLLLINLSDDRDFFPFVHMKVALGAYDKNEIRRKIELLINDYRVDGQELLKAQNYINYLNDNKALDRIYEICLRRLDLLL